MLEAPAAGMSAAWAWVQPRCARHARVQLRSRGAGVERSRRRRPSTPAAVPAQLHALLERAGERGPYVLAGQGLGAAFARARTSPASARRRRARADRSAGRRRESRGRMSRTTRIGHAVAVARARRRAARDAHAVAPARRACRDPCGGRAARVPQPSRSPDARRARARSLGRDGRAGVRRRRSLRACTSPKCEPAVATAWLFLPEEREAAAATRAILARGGGCEQAIRSRRLALAGSSG